MAVYDATQESYELTEVDGKMVLFTNMRIDRDTVPKGLFCYDVRDSDHVNGTLAELRRGVMVNFWGTILSKEPFPLEDQGAYYPEKDRYAGRNMTLAEYQSMTAEQLAEFCEPKTGQPGMAMG